MFLTFLLCSFFSSTNKLPLDERIAYRLMSEFSRNHVRDLQFAGSGLTGDKTNGKLASLDIFFEKKQTLNIESARKLIVENTQQFIYFLNSNKEIQPYITRFPVTPNEVEISISGDVRCNNNNDYVSMVYTHGGLVTYFTDSMTPPNYGRIHKETFEEAVTKLQNSNP